MFYQRMGIICDKRRDAEAGRVRWLCGLFLVLGRLLKKLDIACAYR